MVEAYRENGKVKHRHLSNLTALPEHALIALEKELKGQTAPNEKSYTFEDLRPIQGKNCGAIISILQIAKRLGITEAFGKSRDAQLALVQIMGRIICQSSRNYIANEWQHTQALDECMAVGNFTEDTLYHNLSWLAQQQESIENKLFKLRHKGKK